MANASLRPLYERLNGVLTYHPLSANTFTDWAMEAGDVITVVRGDEEYNVPVHNTSLVWKGSQQITIESNGAKKRDPIARASAKKYGRGGAAVRSSERIFKEMYSEDGYLHSYVLMTESILRTEFTASISGTSADLYSAIEQTATYIMTEVGSAVSDLHSEIIQTAEEIMSSVYANNSQIYSTIDQTASSIRTEVGNAVSDLHSEILQTAEEIMSSVYANNSQIYSTIDQTASSIRTEVGNAVSDLHSEILQTAEEIMSSVYANNSQIYSTIDQTASSIRTEVGNAVSDLHSEIVQTAESITSSVTAANSQIYSTIEQTASSINSTVASTANNLQSQITQSANTISAVVSGTGANAQLKQAKVILAINGDGGSEALIAADKVMIAGTTTINDVFTITNGHVASRGTMYVGDGSSQITLDVSGQGSFISANEVRGALVERSGNTTYTVDFNTLAGMVKDFSVNGNTLTLTRFDGTYENFSKATALVPSWDSDGRGIYTVTATQNGVNVNSLSIPLTTILDSTHSSDMSYFLYAIGESNQSGQPTRRSNWGYLYLVPSGSKIQVRTVDSTIGGTTLAEYQMNLQSKRVTENGLVEPDDGYTGLSSVDVQVPSTTVTPTLTGNWTNNALSVTSTPSPVAPYNTTITSVYGNETYSGTTVHYIKTQHSESSSNPPTDFIKKTISLSAGSLSSGSRTITLQFDGSATGLTYVCNDYGNGETDGKNATNVVGPSWQTTPASGITVNNNLATFTTDAPSPVSGSNKSVRLYLIQDSDWSNNKKNVYIHHTNSDSGNRVAKVEVDASTLVTNAGYAGRAAVNLADPSWATTPSSSITGSSNTVAVSTTGRTNASGTSTNISKSVTLYMTQDANWSSNKKYVYINHTNSTDANRVARLEVDASTLVTNAGYAGRAAVNLANPSWTNAPSSSITGNSNTVTVSTTGRTNSSGTAANVSKSVVLYLTQGSWDNSNKKYVYINQTDSTDANRVARIQVDASTLVSNATTNGKNAVTLNDPTWTSAATHTGSYNTITVTTNGRPTQLSKSVTLYLTQDGWSGGNKLVDMRTNSTTGAVYAETTVSMPNPVSFDTTHADTSVTVSGHTNNASGYYITTAGASGVAGIVSEGSWWAGDKKFTQYSYFEYAPTQLYRKAYGDGNTAGNRAGRAAVTLSDPSADTRTTLNESRTWTVSTVGRQNSSGIAENLSKTVPLHLYANGWSDNTNTVYLKWGATAGSSGTNYAKIVVDATERYNAGYDANHSLYIRNSSSASPVTGTVTLNPGADVDLYAAFNKKSGQQQFQSSPVTVKAAALGDPTNFGTTSPNGESLDISGVGTITNNSDGYYLAASGSSGDAYIIVKANWTQNGQNKTATNYLHAAPTKIYQKGYSDGAASAPSYTRYTFSKTRTQASDGYHYKFEISTGWSTTFGGDGGTYYLYKKN